MTLPEQRNPVAKNAHKVNKSGKIPSKKERAKHHKPKHRNKESQ